jgi:hypothetical protein
MLCSGRIATNHGQRLYKVQGADSPCRRGRLLSICRLIHSSTSDSIQPTALAPKDTGFGKRPSLTHWYTVLRERPVRSSTFGSRKILLDILAPHPIHIAAG